MNVLTRFSCICVSLIFLQMGCQSIPPIALDLPALFSDHMVLQQQEEVTFWGSYTPESDVSISGSWGASAKAISDETGNWKLRLPTPEAGGPYEVKITAADSSILLKDVMIGEVWLASGQSNMEMTLEGYLPNEPIDQGQEEIAAANYPMIRYVNVARAISPIPAKDLHGEWKLCHPDNAHQLSAVAYFFARKLHQELTIPIGIIASSWGGTPVESWMSREKMQALGEFEEELGALKKENIQRFMNWFENFPKVPAPSSSEGWRNLELADSDYAQPNFDDSDWKKGTLPSWIEDLEVPSVDGAIWFRKSVQLEEVEEYILHIEGGIDDLDHCYVNGQLVGFTFCYNCPRAYEIPASLLNKGDNLIAIRAVDTGGPGGFVGPMYLKSATGKQIPLEGDWHFAQVGGIQGANLLLFQQNPDALHQPPEGIENYQLSAGSPSVLYNGMIAPLHPYTLKGAIWYQGESNVGRAEQYLKLFPGMIEDWRSRWQDDFPFYFVQIAPFGYGNELSPALRDAQRKSLTTPQTGMAITMDIGQETSIHPGNKQDVGHRLALLAMHNDYGADLVSSGPLYASHSVEGQSIDITFDHTGSGLMSQGQLEGFEIAGSDGEFVPAKATIVDHKIKVSSSKVKDPMHVRYAWKDYVKGSLFNQEGLPASSFSSE
ncbi:MAG: sialate O-acetylesterase [Bacteroidota bacterium]